MSGAGISNRVFHCKLGDDEFTGCHRGDTVRTGTDLE